MSLTTSVESSDAVHPTTENLSIHLAVARKQKEPPVLQQLATRGMINSDLPAVLRPHVQALGGQLSYNDRHMVLPFEASYRLDMG
jgi:hypothetical protein